MSIPEIGTWFEFVGAELVENSNMRPLSDWENGDKLQVVAHVKMQGNVNPLYWNSRDLSSSTVREDLLEMISDPKPKSKPWSGPEDGLPPVGTVCEYSLGDSNCWYVCDIKYVLRDGHGLVAECHINPSIEQYLNTYHGAECLATFRAIKTEKQLAADKRETAIREFMDVVGIDCRVTASKAVDAGFKREVK